MGKFVILLFNENEEKVLEELISTLSAISDFSTLAASEDAPLLMNSLEIYPQHHLVRLFGMPVDLTPMEFDILLLLARPRPLQQIPMTPAGRGSPAWSINSGASWAPVSSKPFEGTATV